MAIYDRIGAGYDSTRRADPLIVSRLVHHVRIRPGAHYLDVGCGTGNYTLAVASHGGEWHGIDLSKQMIDSARSKSDKVEWRVADASEIPYPESFFAGAMCTLAIHHFTALLPVFREVHRILLGGSFVIFTATPEQMAGYWLNEYFPKAMFRSMQQMPSLDTVIGALHDAGFAGVRTEKYAVQDDLQDLFLYSGKHRPALYLDERIRCQISTFSLLADPTEVEEGCHRLAFDIRTGRIASIVESYANEVGDYLLVVADSGKV